MITCRIAPHLEAHLPANIARGISDNVDIIPIQTSLDCSKSPGLEHLGTLEFGPNLNILSGHAGSGMTRLLEAMKAKTNHDVTLPPLSIPDLSRLSPGEALCQVIRALVELQPIDVSCILLDNVLDYLDRDWAIKLISFLAAQRKQTILTGRCHQIHAVWSSVSNRFALVERTSSVPALIQCWC